MHSVHSGPMGTILCRLRKICAGREQSGDARTESHEQSLCRNLMPILLPIFEKTAELLHAPLEIVDAVDAVDLVDLVARCPPARRDVLFEDVRFRHAPGSDPFTPSRFTPSLHRSASATLRGAATAPRA